MNHIERPGLNIALIFDDSLDRLDGVQQYVRALGRYFKAQGHQVTYIVGQTTATELDGCDVYSMSKNVSVTFNGNRLSVPIWTSKTQVNVLRSLPPFDVLHVQLPNNPMMSGAIIKKLAGVRFGTFHILPSGVVSDWGSRLLGVLLRLVNPAFDQVYAVSKPSQQYARSRYGLNTKLLPNVVELSKYQVPAVRPTQAENKTNVVFLGRLVPRKGCRQLLEALLVLRANANLDGYHVTIMGDGQERASLESFVSTNSLDKHVTFMGRVSEAQKASMLAGADIAVFPSLGGESFGIVLLEAMAAGSKAVIAGDNAGYTSVMEACGSHDGIFDARDPQQLARMLKKYTAGSEASARLRQAQSAAIGDYDVAVVGEHLLASYRSAIAKRVAT